MRIEADRTQWPIWILEDQSCRFIKRKKKTNNKKTQHFLCRNGAKVLKLRKGQSRPRVWMCAALACQTAGAILGNTPPWQPVTITSLNAKQLPHKVSSSTHLSETRSQITALAIKQHRLPNQITCCAYSSH